MEQGRQRNNGNFLGFPSTFPKERIPYWIFNFHEFVPDYVLGDTSAQPTLASITLPLPQAVNDESIIDYNTEGINTLPKQALDSGLDVKGKSIDDITLFVEKKINAADSSTTSSSARLAAQLAAKKKGNFAETAARIISGERLNPHLTVLFNQVNLKPYTVTWSLSPENETEASIITSIIRTLNYHAHPSFGGGSRHLLKWPSICIPAIENSSAYDASSPYIFKPAAIANVTVDYTPTGGGYHVGGFPVVTNITVAMQEVQIVTREDYES